MWPAPRPARVWMAAAMPAGKQRGAGYLAVLMLVLALSVMLAAAAAGWQTRLRREKEADLLFIGQQFRQAIASYHQSGPAPAYPRSLSALLKDDRVGFTRRHLRRLYADPISGGTEWGLIKAGDGGIMGVYSLAPGIPLKQANFPAALGDVGGRASYQEWVFKYDGR